MPVKKTVVDDFVGKKVHLFPHDPYEKIATITDVNDLGWTFTINKAHRTEFNVGDIVFYSHSQGVIFKFLE